MIVNSVERLLSKNRFKFKFGSRERGQCWDSIADVLNDAE